MPSSSEMDVAIGGMVLICGIPKMLVPTAETLVLLMLEMVLTEEEDEEANLEVLIVVRKAEEPEGVCDVLVFIVFGSSLGDPSGIELEGKITGEDCADLW